MINPVHMLPKRDELSALPQYAPLLAAVLAPLSTLLDVPAFSERWFYTNDTSSGNIEPLPDPPMNLALSLLGLIFNIIANGLLIVRFSVGYKAWRLATRVSLACWVIKFGIALGNVLGFGILTRNEPGIQYGEGFWCAVMSLLIATVIVFLLTVHYWHEVSGHNGDQTENQMQVRLAGRHFMLQTTLFVGTVGLLALFMSRVEEWTYLQGMYFSIVSFLTVGFGDFYPTKPVSQIVFFPFALVGIIQLACIIDLIVRFFRERLESHNLERRHAFQRRRLQEEDQLQMEPTLEHELAFLKELFEETTQSKTIRDLATSVMCFLTFWMLGAAIFSQTETWTYGQGLYFCYIFFFAIGFGDYVPITPAGRVVFIVYAIIAVPIMSSFAVQTVQSIFGATSQRLFKKQERLAGVGPGTVDDQVRAIVPGEDSQDEEKQRLPRGVRQRLDENNCSRMNRMEHHQFVARHHQRLDERFTSLESLASRGKEEEKVDETKREEDMNRQGVEDRILTEYVLEMVVELEKHARRLIMGHMDEDSAASLLLRADRIVQLRNIKMLASQEEFPVLADPESSGESSQRSRSRDTRQSSSGVTDEKPGEKVTPNEDASSTVAFSSPPNPSGDNAKHSSFPTTSLMRKYYEEEADLVPFQTGLDEHETLEEVARYREAFAGLLAAGSRLLRLKDKERALFERRYWKKKDEREEEATLKGNNNSDSDRS